MVIGALAEENALAATIKVAESYDQLMLAHRKEVHCTIVTAEVRGRLCGRAMGHTPAISTATFEKLHS